jgi:hypothetical protein
MVKKANFFWPAFHGIALILASCGFIASLSEFLDGEDSTVSLLVFVLGTFALVVMSFRQDTLPTIEGEGTEKLKQRRMLWFLFAHCVIIGVGFNWVSAFLVFSRRYTFFSVQVVGATGLIMVVYAAMGVLAAFLTGGNWRKALLVFAGTLLMLGAFIFRLVRFR